MKRGGRAKERKKSKLRARRPNGPDPKPRLRRFRCWKNKRTFAGTHARSKCPRPPAMTAGIRGGWRPNQGQQMCIYLSNTGTTARRAGALSNQLRPTTASLIDCCMSCPPCPDCCNCHNFRALGLLLCAARLRRVLCRPSIRRVHPCMLVWCRQTERFRIQGATRRCATSHSKRATCTCRHGTTNWQIEALAPAGLKWTELLP